MADNPFLNIFTDVVGSSTSSSSGSNININNKKKKKAVGTDVIPNNINHNHNRVFSIFSAQRPSQPPLAPKPSSSSSILATNRLKSRLNIGWYAAKGGGGNTSS